MSYQTWFEQNKDTIARTQLDPQIIPGASKIFKNATQPDRKDTKQKNDGVSVLDADYIREVGEAELCIFDPMEDMPGSTRRIYESSDFIATLWKNTDGDETPQFSSVAMREDGIPPFFPRNRRKHAETILETGLQAGLLNFEEWARGIETLNQVQEESEAVKLVKENIYSLLKEKAFKGEFAPEELLQAKNLADEFDIKQFAKELNVEIMDLTTLDRKKQPISQSPRLHLQIVSPHGNQSNRSGYQAWHQLHNPIRSSLGKKWNNFLKWNEIQLHEFPKEVQELLLKIHSEVDGKGRKAFEQFDRGYLYKKLEGIKFETEELEKKSKHYVWTYLRSIGFMNNQKDIRRKACWQCKNEIHLNDKTCPSCGADNTKNLGERFTYTYKNRKLYRIFETVNTRNTEPTVLSMFETVQQVARNFWNSEEITIEEVQELSNHPKKKKRNRNKKR